MQIGKIIPMKSGCSDAISYYGNNDKNGGGGINGGNGVSDDDYNNYCSINGDNGNDKTTRMVLAIQ